MHIEFLVEERSAEIALRAIVPKVIGDACDFDVRTFQGKMDLLKSLKGRLLGYDRAWAPGSCRVVVLVDRDDDDCAVLKSKMEEIAYDAGVATRSSGAPFLVVNRIAIEELEAWFFGDIDAVCTAYPRVSPDVARSRRHRNPDTIRGGTCEALERVLRNAGYYAGGMPKTIVARDVSRHMDPDRNTSASFQLFVRTLRELAQNG